MFIQNIPILILTVVNGIFLILTFYKNEKVYMLIAIVIFLTLTLLQIKSTNLKNVYSFTPAEIDLQTQRMNYYPPKLARLGYILEKKREIQIFNMLQMNFFETIDVGNYFKNYFPLGSLPFFLFGIFVFFKNQSKVPTMMFFSAIGILTFFGIHGEYGPFLIFPFIYLFILIGIMDIIKLFWRS